MTDINYLRQLHVPKKNNSLRILMAEFIEMVYSKIDTPHALDKTKLNHHEIAW